MIDDKSTLVWQGFGYGLLVDPKQLNLINNPGYLSIIKYPANKNVSSWLKSYPGFIAKHSLGEIDIGLVMPSSLTELNELAEKAHELSGLCGSIETINLNHPLIENNVRLATWYNSLARFDAHDELLNRVSLDQVRVHIQDILQNFETRFHDHEKGQAFTGWLKKKLEKIFEQRDDATIVEVSHEQTMQKSLVLSIKGSQRPDEIVIIGAHLDTISRDGENAPGADDNATGISMLLHLAELIASRDLKFARTIEFHAYAAEEVGLIGSRDIANNYQNESKKIASMLQIDMAGYKRNGSESMLYLIDSDTSRDLIRSAKNYLNNYNFSKYKVKALKGGGTSDHKAWHERGFPTLFAFEDPEAYNPFIHSSRDVIAELNNDELIVNIGKLALTHLAYSAGLSIYQESYNKIKDQIWSASTTPIYYYIGQKSENSDQVFWLSTDNSVTQIEICEIKDKQADGCSSERIYADSYLEQDDIRFFDMTNKLNLQNYKALRIEAYAGDTIAGHRQLSIE